MIPAKKLKLGFYFREKKFKKYHLLFNQPVKLTQLINENSLKLSNYYLIQALDSCYMTERQIVSFSKLLKKELRILSPKVKIRSNMIPYFFCTRKPKDIRMGRGKGFPSLRVFPLKKGDILFEVQNILHVDLIILRNLFKKLPISVSMVRSSFNW